MGSYRPCSSDLKNCQYSHIGKNVGCGPPSNTEGRAACAAKYVDWLALPDDLRGFLRQSGTGGGACCRERQRGLLQREGLRSGRIPPRLSRSDAWRRVRPDGRFQSGRWGKGDYRAGSIAPGGRTSASVSPTFLGEKGHRSNPTVRQRAASGRSASPVRAIKTMELPDSE
jgi:hypothetical protein